MLLYFYRRLCGSDGGDAWYEKMLKVFQLFMLYISKMRIHIFSSCFSLLPCPVWLLVCSNQIALKPDFFFLGGGHKTRERNKEERKKEKNVFESSVKLRSVGSFQHDVSRLRLWEIGEKKKKKKKRERKSGKRSPSSVSPGDRISLILWDSHLPNKNKNNEKKGNFSK